MQAIISGAETIDDDVVMKARGIALNRGIDVQ
jgi:DNA-binding protein